MSASVSLLSETAGRLFADLADVSADDARAPLAEAGFEQLLVPESAGGFGGDWEDAFAVLRLAGAHALPGALPDLIAGSWVARQAGLESERAVIALHADGGFDGARFTGHITVPWAHDATHVIVEEGNGVAMLAIADACAETSANPAGETRDRLSFSGAPALRGAGRAMLWGAWARTAQIAGALDAALALSISYANERTQFGKPIGKLQAVQQSLAEFAEEAAGVNCAGRAAARAADCGDAFVEIAAAKLCASQAAAVGARVAHQVHGAIGFTREHKLHRYTSRLTSWRSEYGGERYWGVRLGAWAAQTGADALWPELVRRSDAQAYQSG